MTASPAGPGCALVVGLGSPDRGDDAVGPIVAHRLAALQLPAVQVVEREDPTSLIDLWSGRDLAIVVDAVCSDGLPGTLMVVESGVACAPLPDDAWNRTGRGGTHAFGLAAAVELSRALDRLPERLVLIGIEAARFGHGEPLSAAVGAAVDRAVEAVLGLLSEHDLQPRHRHPEPGGGRPARSAKQADR